MGMRTRIALLAGAVLMGAGLAAAPATAGPSTGVMSGTYASARACAADHAGDPPCAPC